MELLTHRLLIEHAKHGVLAVYRRHDGDAEVDGTLRLSVFHAEAPVLWNPPFRNIQLAHHLDAGDDGSVMLLANRWHGLREHSVNAKLDAHRVIAGFNVDVTGSTLQGREYRCIHQAND